MPATIQPTAVSHPLFGSTLPGKDHEDPVLKAAQRIISLNNLKNRILCHVSLPLSLEALPYTSLDHNHGRYYRISRASLLGNYPEYSNYDGMWDTVVRIRLTGRTVEVRDGDSWLPLGDYLSHLPPVKEYWSGPGSTSWLQSLEWNTNGQHFPLMSLPGEIRNMIYDYCASFCYPYEFEHGFNYMAAAGTDGLLYREYGRSGTHLRAELFGRGRVLNGAGPVLALLQTSRQVNSEFSARLYRNMEFRFQGAWPLQRFLECKPDFRTLAKVTLQMTTWNFVKFFGVWLHRAARPWGEPDARCLRGLRLKELELRLGHRENFAAEDGGAYRLDALLAPCCHRVLAGLILWAAKDYVKDVSTVSVEGCVPAKVKEAFLQLLADEKEKVPSAITQWDVIGKSAKLVDRGESWLVRTDSYIIMAPLRAAGVLSLFAACCQAVTINSDYFPWPLKAAAVPEVHNGDTLNVTWNSTQTQAILYHWCGGTLSTASSSSQTYIQSAHFLRTVETIPGLGGNGNHVFVVNSSWTSPCHWQFVNQANSENYFDSGWIDVTNVKATPAVTWVPSATGEACGIQATTVTAAATSVAATNAISSSPAACTASTDAAAAHGPNLSSGASMGIGIAVGLAIAAVTAAVWIPLRRRCLRPIHPNSSQGSSEAAVQRHMSQRLPEADGQARCEMDSTGKVGHSSLIELPSSPGRRFP